MKVDVHSHSKVSGALDVDLISVKAVLTASREKHIRPDTR